MKSTLNILLIIICFFLAITLAGCGEKFDKTRWDDVEGGPEKRKMAEDLVKTNKLIGLTNEQMLQLIGSPVNDTTETWYRLEEEYEFLGIDPVSGSDLIIKFNKDSVITHAEVKEWHKH
jgi:outer membrane protein assembly factor BamE (lipoprotein component of BamABCDE complex)